MNEEAIALVGSQRQRKKRIEKLGAIDKVLGSLGIIMS